MEFSLSPQDQERIKNMARHKLELELYGTALSLGIIPESLTFINGVCTWQPEPNSGYYTNDAELHLRDVLDVYEQFIQL